MERKEREFRSGFVSIVGKPNAGKSSILNALLDQKLSIVSGKPQTTRRRITGILNTKTAQIVFLDTPGLIDPEYMLQEEMVKNIRTAAIDSDIILVIVDAEREQESCEELVSFLSDILAEKPSILAINKTDKVDNNVISKLTKRCKNLRIFKEVIPVSAIKTINIEKLYHSILGLLQVHEPYYPDDILSEQTDRFFVSEFIREAIIKYYREEIPYSTAVEVRQFKERKNAKSFIDADIIVERESQKKIIIGKGGGALKKIGVSARKEIESFLHNEVYLDLHVVVRTKWRNDPAMLKKYGYYIGKVN